VEGTIEVLVALEIKDPSIVFIYIAAKLVEDLATAFLDASNIGSAHFENQRRRMVANCRDSFSKT
jgi:hypothetical protein